ncbi:hypothetical protein ACFHW2_42950 [Actinomadura sp. LOL_016]
MKKPWRAWPDISTMSGAIIAATVGGTISALIAEGLHYLIV